MGFPTFFFTKEKNNMAHKRAVSEFTDSGSNKNQMIYDVFIYMKIRSSLFTACKITSAKFPCTLHHNEVNTK